METLIVLMRAQNLRLWHQIHVPQNGIMVADHATGGIAVVTITLTLISSVKLVSAFMNSLIRIHVDTKTSASTLTKFLVK